MTEFNLHPDSNQPNQSVFNGNKGLLIAIVLGVIAAVVGVSAFLNSGSGNQYEGLIKKVESETQQLKTQGN